MSDPKPARPSPSASRGESETKRESGQETKPASVTFFFEKIGTFQTLHADGVMGSITPSGQVFLAFYIDRAPIPKTAVFPITSEGTLGEATSFTGKQGVFREVQTAVILTPAALKGLKEHVEKLLKNFDNA